MKKVSRESPSRALIYIYQYLLKTCLSNNQKISSQSKASPIHWLNIQLFLNRLALKSTKSFDFMTKI